MLPPTFELPVGANPLPEPGAGVRFRVWAPRRRTVDVLVDGVEYPLDPEPDRPDYFGAVVPQARPGSRYKCKLDGGDSFPDPASRFQPDGPHHASAVVDPAAFPWTDAGWRGVALPGQVIYELHVGTFTRQGTFAAAAGHFAELAALGVTVLEIMPVAEFPGRFGWGYDGVHPFAPSHLYGSSPDDFRRFVDLAHAAGLGVILDVVYNHLGPDGNYFSQFSRDYFTSRHHTDWGEAINFDGRHSAPVREFFVSNAAYWIAEYHLDGLRLDATDSIFDSTAHHILAEIGEAVRSAAAGRDTIVVAENDPQDRRLIDPVERGGYGLDAVWNDDFHHSARAAATGRRDAYATDFRGTPQELISAVKYGFLYQGQWHGWRGRRRGTSTLGCPPASFVNFIENHDQVSNSARGDRLHQLTTAGRYKALTALTLLAPGTPMLFQGQEFAASAPFAFFADHTPALARAVREGRAAFLAKWRNLRTPEMRGALPDPAARETFERCRLDHAERERAPNAGIYALYRDLLAIRRRDAAFRDQRPGDVDGAVLGTEAFLLRFGLVAGEPAAAADQRLLLVNLGIELDLDPAPEPLLAPPFGMRWELELSTEELRYGGDGAPPLDSDSEPTWRLPAHAAILLRPAPE